MENRITLHIIDPSSRNRAEISRVAFALGHHAEVYADLQELTRHPPKDGIIIVRDSEKSIEQTLSDLSEAGIWLPVVGTHEELSARRIVAAIKAGALDYLPLPIAEERLGTTLVRIAQKASSQADTRRRMMEARGRIDNLSGREREVLDWLTEGSSNKDIARALEISPRTVEIHRSNMMTKLGAKHAAQAVRLRIEAKIEPLQMA
ncbi:LuxR C-terminal-related transcriptional regulator [Altererythrobacter sp. ZODW24]|uniref:response regulator transcription factor n=1 Tax=Altererythrobacter sp. ZODW24 TaxID=2185142 RepID=UPI000DF7E826|nr:LuxR C-terminal-related transcriptional regulator [Altererythrobacter sp. ZODW24]